MAKIWLRGDYLLNAHLPLCPPHRIITFNIEKMVAYAKSKGSDGYPDITYDCWRYLAVNKLQICHDLAELYFNVASDFCKSIPTLAVKSATNTDGKKKVSLLGFAVFLFVQQANRFNLRASMSGLEKRPRTYSENEGNTARSRRSSVGGSAFGQENIESKVTEFLLSNLQALLELVSVYDGTVTDYHKPKPNADTLTWNSLAALDLILEGQRSLDPTSILPFSAIMKVERSDLIFGPLRIRMVEDFIRKSMQSDPFAVAVPFADMFFMAGNDGIPASIAGPKRSSSENGLSPDSPKLKEIEAKDLVTPRGGKIVHNGRTAPKSHRIVVVSCVHRQTIGKNSEAISDTVLHIGKCVQSHIYMMSPFKSVMIRRCRGSTFLLGPAAGTIRVNNCYDCTLIVMCRRLLISDCQRCTIYVKTPMRPIIVGSTSSDLTFAPYCSWYGELEQQMVAAGIGNRPDRWKEPVVFANGDSKRYARDSVAKAWRLMDPKDFYPVSIPFRLPGETKTIPGGLPAEYKRALEERQTFFNEWNQYTAGLEDEERQLVKELVEKEYAAWLEKTARMEELQQLKMLEARQRYRHVKN